MVVAYSTSQNGHNRHPVPVDPVEEEQPKPCALRLGHGSWCYLPDGHEGEHEGVPPVYGPIEERPPLWRTHKGRNG